MTRFLTILTVVALGILLWWRLQVSFVRLYDVDEFAYLHWAKNVWEGSVPIIDFFSYTTPGYLLVYQFFFAFGREFTPLVLGRMTSFFLYLSICWALGILFVRLYGQNRRFQYFLPALMLTALPLPADKFIEIRPDILAFAIVLWAMVVYVKGSWFLSGFLYSLSFVVFNKTVPFIAAALLISIVHWKKFKSFGLGFLVPLAIFGIWMLSTGEPAKVWYSLVTLPFEIAKNTQVPWRHMSVSLFFYPNVFFYGQPGWGSVIFANHVLWFGGLFVWIVKFFTPWVDSKAEEQIWGRLLVAVSLFFSILAFYHLYQMRHAQYLMPIAIFIGFYLALVVSNMWRSLGLVFVYVVLLIGLLSAGHTWYTAKLTMTNTDARSEMKLLWRTIPVGAYVFDLDCRTLYYRDPYPISCLPFGDFSRDVSRPFPPIRSYLDRSQPSYIYIDSLGRLDSLPEEDKSYIRNTFAPHPNYSRILLRI